MTTTQHRNYQLPDTMKDIDQEFYALQLSVLPMIDLDIHSLFVGLGGKAAADHVHTVDTIQGLTEVLAGKMSANATFSLAGLSDVLGAADAPDGYVVVKDGAGFRVMSIAAAIGEGISMALVLNLNSTLGAMTEAIGTRAAANHVHGINDLTDVDTATSPPVNGQGLVWQVDKYVPGPAGGGMFKGNNNTVGDRKGDIFRINAQVVTVDVTIAADENASAAGPISVAVGKTLTVASGGNLSIT